MSFEDSKVDTVQENTTLSAEDHSIPGLESGELLLSFTLGRSEGEYFVERNFNTIIPYEFIGTYVTVAHSFAARYAGYEMYAVRITLPHALQVTLAPDVIERAFEDAFYSYRPPCVAPRSVLTYG